MSTFTPNYELIQFDQNDEPSWLGAWNDTMSTIDTALATIASNITGVVTNVSDAKVAADQAAASANAAKLAADAAKGVATTANTNAAASLGQSQLLLDRSGDVYYFKPKSAYSKKYIASGDVVQDSGWYYIRTNAIFPANAPFILAINGLEMLYGNSKEGGYINLCTIIYLEKEDIITCSINNTAEISKLTGDYIKIGKFNYNEENE